MSDPFKGRPRVFRDPIHGNLAFPERLWKCITALTDTPAFQRLRHIRQNGITNLVFHGAEHSRFSHSLGVAWTASRMLAAIQRNSGISLSDEEHDDTVLAALLHDVGHGPFSHTLEDILRELEVGFDHEEMTKRLMVESEPGLATILDETSSGRSKRLVDFIDKHNRVTTHWWHAIVSSQLDADRLDYVRRDAAMAGIDNHRPDIGRLIENLGVFENRIVVDHRALDVVESFLLALDHMYESVYLHKAVRGGAILLGATLRRAATMLDTTIPDRADPIRALVGQGQAIDLARYVRATDASIWVHLDRWRDSSDSTLQHLATRLAIRSLPRSLDYPTDSIRKADKLKAKARELADSMYPDVDADFLIAVDEPSRLNYKRHVVGEGSNDSIQTFRAGATKPRAIEDEQRTLMAKVSQKFDKKRMFVPDEIHRALVQFARHEGITG